MHVYTRTFDAGRDLHEIKVEVATMGIPFIRGLFGYAESFSDKAVLTIEDYRMPDVFGWLNDAFDVEIVNKAAQLLDASRIMGLKYVKADEYNDINKWYYEQVEKVNIAHAHLEHNQLVDAVAPDRYSAFVKAIDSEDLDFNKEIDGE